LEELAVKEVAVIAIINDHHMLMGKRRDNGKWTNPGGHLNPGEEPLTGAVREVKEETGLSLDPHLFKSLETRIIKKPSGQSLKVHGYRINLASKPPTSMKEDPDGEVFRWVWVKLDTDLEHIKDNLHVPLGDNVLLDKILREKPMKRHINKFWKSARKVGKGAMEDIYDKGTKEVPQKYVQNKSQEKKAGEIITGGKADWMKDDRFSDEQLRMGVSVEREHTKDPRLAKEIAKDHLTEDKNYYTHLKEMEDKYVEKKAFWSGFLGE
jgi:8-oxo-dGTP pyrophosphatase MutT (NUDIX family)